jgi:hypothetical protein
MLFDLRGKRKRVVQVSYALLALLFLVGFVGFGIGVGGGPGGIFDALGLTSNGGSGSVSDQFDEEIDAANQKLAKNPNDANALLQLAENEYFKARTGVSQDQTTGEFTISNDAHTDLGNAADAWQKYLKVEKGEPDTGVAAEMVNVYIFLNNAEGAATAQRIIAEDQPGSTSYGTLALFEYAGGDIAAGDAARKKALAEAPKSQEKSIKTQLEAYRKQGLKLQQQQEQAKKQGGGAPTTPGANPLQNPFGGLPTTPAPAP